MPIRSDHSSLPFPSRKDGLPPVPNPQVVPILAQRWFDKYQAEGQVDLAKAIPSRRFRASWAGKRCDRSLQYALTDEPASDPLTIADYWRFGIGTMVHEALQDVLLQLFPGSEVEVKIDLLPIGVDGSATVDIVLAPTDDSRPVVIEVKTINGFGFKKAATAFKGPAEGPRWGAIVQGALSAAALDADLIIAYLSLENLSPNLATSYGDGTDVGRFAAEWHFDHEAVKQIAADETARINRVLALTDAGVLAPRAIHDPEVHPGGVVTNPDTGNWMVLDGENVVGTGRTWMCGYCDHATKCAADGAGGATHAEDF